MFLLSLSVTAAVGCKKQSIDAAAIVDGNSISKQSIVAAVPDNDGQKRQAKLDMFVSEQVLANAAIHDKLDAQPEVASALEISRRTILARAYIATLEKRLTVPPDSEVQNFYVKRPELFSERRIYRLQEIAIVCPASRVPEIKQAFHSLKTFNDRAEWLRNEKIPFTVGASIKPAEELPADLIVSMLQMHDGSSFDLPTATGFTTVQITGIEEKPLTILEAQASIQRFLRNMELSKLIDQETARLRKAASIEYGAPYAAPGTSAPAP